MRTVACSKNKEGDDPFDCVVWGDDEDMKRMLQKSDVKEWINSRDTSVHANTLLHLASSLGRTLVAKHLILAGADLNCLDNDGMSAVDIAIKCRDVETVDTLLSAGACFRDEQNLENIRSRSEGMANVITKHLIWRRRKSFLMFLATQKYLSKRGETSGGDQEWLETRSLSSPVHRVLMSEDMQRLLMAYL